MRCKHKRTFTYDGGKLGVKCAICNSKLRKTIAKNNNENAVPHITFTQTFESLNRLKLDAMKKTLDEYFGGMWENLK